jgi:uncharacterized membrane protein HdeD (DUF308 family)
MAKEFEGRRLVASSEEVRLVQEEWPWFLALGLGLIVLGLIAIGIAPLVTLATVVLLGVVLLVGGIIQTVSAFRSPKWSGVFLRLVIGILYVVVAGLIIGKPLKGAESLTLLMGAFFIFAGVTGIVWSLYLQFHQWGWVLLNGIITLVLGVFIWSEWPEASLFLIGIFVGLEMIFNGAAWAMLALSLRRIGRAERPAEPPAKA